MTSSEDSSSESGEDESQNEKDGAKEVEGVCCKCSVCGITSDKASRCFGHVRILNRVAPCFPFGVSARGESDSSHSL